MNNIVLLQSCRLCHSANLQLVLPLAPIPLSDAYVDDSKLGTAQYFYPLDLYMCKECGHVQLLVDFPERCSTDKVYKISESFTYGNHFSEYASDLIKKTCPVRGAFAVDICSNDGTLLHELRKYDLNVFGIEPVVQVAGRAESLGIPTRSVAFSADAARTIRDELGAAFLITANKLLANITDLDGFMEGVKALLAPDGWFVFENFYLGDFISNTVFDFAYHEHLSYFAIAPLKAFFQKHGFRIVDVTRTSLKGGSLRYYVRRIAAGGAESDDLVQQCEKERLLNLASEKTYADYLAKISFLRSQSLLVLRNAKQLGKSIACYGASATSTTLFYYFGLDVLVDYFIDDCPQKVGCYSPGLHIPVYSSDSITQMKPDYIFIAAWRYARDIMSKNAGYTSAGGQWIVPLPELKIYSGEH